MDLSVLNEVRHLSKCNVTGAFYTFSEYFFGEYPKINGSLSEGISGEYYRS